MDHGVRTRDIDYGVTVMLERYGSSCVKDMDYGVREICVREIWIICVKNISIMACYQNRCKINFY